MRTRRCEDDLLCILASMPFLDRLDMASISGRSRGAVYQAIGKLEGSGLVTAIPHSNSLIPPTRRYSLTAAGLHRLARNEGMTVDELMDRFPVSERARRLLMGRLDAAAVIYRLNAALSEVAFPIRFRWYRAMPMDAFVTMPDGRTLAIVRQGTTSDRTAFAKRMWKLKELYRPSAVLMLMADEVRLRHARRIMSNAPSLIFFALERDVANSGAGTAIWHTPSGSAILDLSVMLAHTGVRDPWPTEKPYQRVSMPTVPYVNGSRGQIVNWMLPSVLKPTEKRPWI